MAGFYPDVPANRFAYHLDGTKIYTLDDANTLTDITTQAAVFNDEDNDYYQAWNTKAVIFIFPEPRDLSAYYFNDLQGTVPQSLQASGDTANGLDGTWSSVVNPWIREFTNPLPGYRTKINTATAGAVKALKFNYNNGTPRLANIHLYGSIPPTSNPNRLIFWEPVSNNPTGGAYFDWGDVVQGSTQTKSFRIKNNSSTQTANSITVSAAAETYAMSVQFSQDNTTFTGSINIGNLAPGALSGVLYVRRTVPAAEPLQMQASYFKAHANSWT